MLPTSEPPSSAAPPRDPTPGEKPRGISAFLGLAPPRQDALRDRGTRVIVFVVAMAIGVSLYEARAWSWDLALRSTAFGLVYVGFALWPGERLVRHGPLLPKVLYFTLQPLVLVGLVSVFLDHRLFGVAWLFFMPLVSQSRMVLDKWGAAAVSLTSMGIIVWHIHSLAGWDGVPGTVFAVGTAFAFVLVFTDVAMRESAARADSQRLSAELEEANRRLGEYAVQAEDLSAERERARVAREIHDSVGHSLTAVNMQIEAARAMLDRDPARTRGALDKAQDCIRDGLAEIRRSVSTLRADPLDGRDLHAALADLADLSQTSGLPVRLSILGRQRPLSEAVSLVLFRTAQEGLTNARKHARAKRVRIELEYGPAGENGHGEPGAGAAERMRMRIIDDGIGAATTDGGFGLLGLRERARQLDGELRVDSDPGEGLCLSIELPTAPPERAEA